MAARSRNVATGDNNFGPNRVSGGLHTPYEAQCISGIAKLSNFRHMRCNICYCQTLFTTIPVSSSQYQMLKDTLNPNLEETFAVIIIIHIII